MAAPMQTRRVVVTGIGIVSAAGCNLSHILQDVMNRVSHISKLQGSEWDNIPCRVAGLVRQSELENDYTAADLREKSRPILYAIAAAKRALSDSYYETENTAELDECGVSVGMGMPDLEEVYKTGRLLTDHGYRSISPFFIPRNLVNMAAGHISMLTGFKGPNLSVSTACTTGLHAIGEAFRLIERGDAQLMLCGGSEAPISPLGMAGFCRMRALCVDSNDAPEQSSRPFDVSRSGFVMSEGAAVLVIESLHHALSRGARIYGEILGYGLSGDAYHISAPRKDGDGAYRCMKLALSDSMLQSDDVTYINAHATSTPLGDAAEANAIHRLFGGNRSPVNVSSVKGTFGHLLGAAGSLEAAITALACYNAVLPPTANLTNSDIRGHLNLVDKPNQVWSEDQRIALTNSFGFGGTNASLCISNYLT